MNAEKLRAKIAAQNIEFGRLVDLSERRAEHFRAALENIASYSAPSTAQPVLLAREALKETPALKAAERAVVEAAIRCFRESQA